MNQSEVQQMRKLRESILCRFIINLPEEEMAPMRLFFHLQEAYWYYVDHICTSSLHPPNIEKLNEAQFYDWITRPLPNKNINENVQKLWSQHKSYCRTISQYGAVLLNLSMDSVLLVKNFRQTVYSFPKGKVNQNEDEMQCAIREVWEEVGYDISRNIKAGDYIQFQMEDTKQIQRMYIIQDVDEKYEFKTYTKNEIGGIEWIKIQYIIQNQNKFQTLFPFIWGVQKYIKNFKKPGNQKQIASPEKQQKPQNLLQQDLIQEFICNQQQREIVEKFEKILNEKMETSLKQFRDALQGGEQTPSLKCIQFEIR